MSARPAQALLLKQYLQQWIVKLFCVSTTQYSECVGDMVTVELANQGQNLYINRFVMQPQ